MSAYSPVPFVWAAHSSMATVVLLGCVGLSSSSVGLVDDAEVIGWGGPMAEPAGSDYPTTMTTFRLSRRIPRLGLNAKGIDEFQQRAVVSRMFDRSGE